MIQAMADDGVTVVMCTHLLLEAEGLAQQVVVMEGGTDLVSGAPDELTRRYWPTPVVRLDAADTAAIATVVTGLPGVVGIDVEGARSSELAGMAATNGRAGGPIDVRIDDGDRIPDLIAALVARGVRLTRVEPHVPSLEDLYFAVRQQNANGLQTLADDGGRRLAPERIGRP
jgi:ABC-2 type transport system ATP-binding protein